MPATAGGGSTWPRSGGATAASVSAASGCRTGTGGRPPAAAPDISVIARLLAPAGRPCPLSARAWIRPTNLSITLIVCSWRGMGVGPYPTERDGPTPVGTSVARGGADGPRRECLDRSRDRRMPVRRRAAGPTVACAARPDGGRDGREHPARLPGLGQHQGGLPLLLQ